MDGSCCTKAGLLTRIKEASKYYWTQNTDAPQHNVIPICLNQNSEAQKSWNYIDDTKNSGSASLDSKETVNNDTDHRNKEYDYLDCENDYKNIKDKSKCDPNRLNVVKVEKE